MVFYLTKKGTFYLEISKLSNHFLELDICLDKLILKN